MIKDRVLGPLLMASLLYLALNFLFPMVHFFSALCELSTMCQQSTCLCIVKLRFGVIGVYILYKKASVHGTEDSISACKFISIFMDSPDAELSFFFLLCCICQSRFASLYVNCNSFSKVKSQKCKLNFMVL